LGVEFVAQVVQGVRLAVRVGAERGTAGCDQVVQVSQDAGETGAEPADLGVQARDRVECGGELRMAEVAWLCWLTTS
jgi:hypothetical protein